MASRSQPASKMSPNVSKCLQNVSKMSPYVSLETFSPSTGYTKLKFLTPSLTLGCHLPTDQDTIMDAWQYLKTTKNTF